MNRCISEKILELRKARNLTQEQLGEKLGITGQAISKWEKGESLPDIMILPTLCSILGISIDSLMEMPLEAEKTSLFKNFDNYAQRNGTPQALIEAFMAVSNKPAPDGSPCEGLQYSISSDYLKVYDPRGMGYVFYDNEYLRHLLSFDIKDAAGFFNLLSNESILAIIQLLSFDSTISKEEIVQATGVDEDELGKALLIMHERQLICCGYDTKGKYGYMFNAEMMTLIIVLTGYFLSTNNGRTKDVKGVGFSISRKSNEYSIYEK